MPGVSAVFAAVAAGAGAHSVSSPLGTLRKYGKPSMLRSNPMMSAVARVAGRTQLPADRHPVAGSAWGLQLWSE